MAGSVERRAFLGAAGVAAAGLAAGAASAQQATGKGLRIVGVACSPRKGKTTAAALTVCLQAAKEVLETRVVLTKESLNEDPGHPGVDRPVQDRGPSFLVNRHEGLGIAMPVAAHLHDPAGHAPRLDFFPDRLQRLERPCRAPASGCPDPDNGEILFRV